MHPVWSKLIRIDNANLSYWYVNIHDTVCLVIEAGGEWMYYMPKNLQSMNPLDYNFFQCEIYAGPHPGDHASAIKHITSGKMALAQKHDFNMLGINPKHGAASLWTIDGTGAYIAQDLIELMYDDMCRHFDTGAIEEVTYTPVKREPVRCRACSDPDSWNDPDFIGDGMYTCWRCRNHINMWNRGVPVDKQDEFRAHYRSIDTYTRS